MVSNTSLQISSAGNTLKSSKLLRIQSSSSSSRQGLSLGGSIVLFSDLTPNSSHSKFQFYFSPIALAMYCILSISESSFTTFNSQILILLQMLLLLLRNC